MRANFLSSAPAFITSRNRAFICFLLFLKSSMLAPTSPPVYTTDNSRNLGIIISLENLANETCFSPWSSLKLSIFSSQSPFNPALSFSHFLQDGHLPSCLNIEGISFTPGLTINPVHLSPYRESFGNLGYQ